LHQVKRGRELLPLPAPPPAISKRATPRLTPEERQRQREQEEQAWQEINAQCARSVFGILQTLKGDGILQGKFLYAYESQPDRAYTALVLVADTEPPDLVQDLFRYGTFSRGDSCWNRLFGSVHGRNDEQDWIGIVIVRDCDWHDDRSPGFEGGLECFSSTFQLIEQLPFLLDATVEAVGDVFHDHAPISTVRAMLQDTDTTTERPLSTPSRSATDDRKAVMRNRKNDKHIQR
jgi:hypothetical protein